MHYVYVLFSTKTKVLYKGSTSDLKRRMNDHNRGYVTSTKNGCPWKLVYYAAFQSKRDALCEERFRKSGKGKERLAFLLQDTMSSFG